jgi:hypothetical protein
MAPSRSARWHIAAIRSGLLAILLITTGDLGFASELYPDIPHKLSPCEWYYDRCIGPGIFMDEPITIKVKETLFKIPAIYFARWPKSDWVGRVVELKTNPPSFDFTFWMPTKRPEEIKTDPPMVIPELLRLGAKPAPGEFPVTVLDVRFANPDDPDLILPERRLTNIMRRAERSPSDTFERIFGLERFKLARDPTSFDHFHNLPGNEPQFLFRCAADAPYPTCDGNVYFDVDKLSFYIRFPYQHIRNWSETVMAARELIYSWRR